MYCKTDNSYVYFYKCKLVYLVPFAKIIKLAPNKLGWLKQNSTNEYIDSYS